MSSYTTANHDGVVVTYIGGDKSLHVGTRQGLMRAELGIVGFPVKRGLSDGSPGTVFVHDGTSRGVVSMYDLAAGKQTAIVRTGAAHPLVAGCGDGVLLHAATDQRIDLFDVRCSRPASMEAQPQASIYAGKQPILAMAAATMETMFVATQVDRSVTSCKLLMLQRLRHGGSLAKTASVLVDGIDLSHPLALVATEDCSGSGRFWVAALAGHKVVATLMWGGCKDAAAHVVVACCVPLGLLPQSVQLMRMATTGGVSLLLSCRNTKQLFEYVLLPAGRSELKPCRHDLHEAALDMAVDESRVDSMDTLYMVHRHAKDPRLRELTAYQDQDQDQDEYDE